MTNGWLRTVCVTIKNNKKYISNSIGNIYGTERTQLLLEENECP